MLFSAKVFIVFPGNARRFPTSLQQLALLLLPDQRETAPQGLHGEVRFAENELVDDFRRKQRQPGCLRHHAGIDTDGFRQHLDVGVGPIVDQRLPVESSGKIQQQRRIASRQVGRSLCGDPFSSSLSLERDRNLNLDIAVS